MHPYPGDASYVAFMMVCSVLMVVGFTAIIVLAGGLVDRDTFEKDDE